MYGAQRPYRTKLSFTTRTPKRVYHHAYRQSSRSSLRGDASSRKSSVGRSDRSVPASFGTDQSAWANVLRVLNGTCRRYFGYRGKVGPCHIIWRPGSGSRRVRRGPSPRSRPVADAFARSSRPGLYVPYRRGIGYP